jgi:hypothetical protein
MKKRTPTHLFEGAKKSDSFVTGHLIIPQRGVKSLIWYYLSYTFCKMESSKRHVVTRQSEIGYGQKINIQVTVNHKNLILSVQAPKYPFTTGSFPSKFSHVLWATLSSCKISKSSLKFCDSKHFTVAALSPYSQMPYGAESRLSLPQKYLNPSCIL